MSIYCDTNVGQVSANVEQCRYIVIQVPDTSVNVEQCRYIVIQVSVKLVLMSSSVDIL